MYITYIGEKNCFLTENVLESSYQSYLEERISGNNSYDDFIEEERISGNNSYDDFIEDDRCLEILEKLRATG